MDTNSSLYLVLYILCLPCGICVIVISLLFMGWSLFNEEYRKGSLQKTRAHFKSDFVTVAPPLETYKSILQFAHQNGYRIDDFDEQNLSVVLNEKMTLVSYGALYPIYVRESENKTIVEVGITSKLGKVGVISPIDKKLITRRLERTINAIQTSLFAVKTIN